MVTTESLDALEADDSGAVHEPAVVDWLLVVATCCAGAEGAAFTIGCLAPANDNAATTAIKTADMVDKKFSKIFVLRLKLLLADRVIATPFLN